MYKQNTTPSAVGVWCLGSSAQCTFFFSTFDADDNNKNPKHTDYNLQKTGIKLTANLTRLPQLRKCFV